MGKDTSYPSKEKSTKMNAQFEQLCPKNKTLTFIKETLLKLNKIHIEPHSVIVEDFNTPLIAMDRT